MERLAGELRHYRDGGVIEKSLGRLVGIFGDGEGVAAYWADLFASYQERCRQNPHDAIAHAFVADTLFSILALQDAAEKREVAYNRIVAKLERIGRRHSHHPS